MGKLFRGKGKYSDEEFDDEEMLEDDSEEDEDDSEEDEDDSEEDEDDSEEDEDDSEEDEDDEEEDEEDRRAYRRRRRIRNQIIAYAVVFVLLAALIAGGVVIGIGVAGKLREKRQAAEEEKLQEQLAAEQEAEAAHDVAIGAPEEMEEPEEDYMGELVDAILSEMPLEDKVAGMFIVTPEALTGYSTVTQAGDVTQEALNKYAVGGLIYFAKNIEDEEQLKALLSGTESMSRYPIFLGVDEEGGTVSRVAGSGIGVIQVGDMAAIGESGDTSQAYEAGLTIGAYLKDMGFNLDFAPVADVAAAGEGELGDRVFGSDPALVSEMVANLVDGLEGTGVSSCLKHFPGIGDVEGDTHDGKVETAKTLDEMRASDFPTFQAGIDAGADFVMVSHVTAGAVDEASVPCSMSETIMNVLRDELGFEGVIITDALDMGAITEYYTSGEAAVQAIAAGADMLLMPENFQEAYEGVLAAVKDGTIPEERINESLERIYRIKCADKLSE